MITVIGIESQPPKEGFPPSWKINCAECYFYLSGYLMKDFVKIFKERGRVDFQYFGFKQTANGYPCHDIKFL